MRNEKLLNFTEVGVLSSIGIILDYLSSLFGVAWPNGGSIGVAMVAILIMAYRRGLLYGLLTGLIIGLLQILYAGEGFLNIFQAFFDYYGAYAIVGVAGIIYPLSKRKYKIATIIIGTFIGCLLRFILHTIGGVVFWKVDWIGSILYNGSYMLPSFILTTVVMILIFTIQPQLLIPDLKEE
ncbi:MAG: energy-coupled thiamine transporter ThiT [Bacilli bacterium]|jgi:thiamine transporter|nr:energy-coupled thiamine transporter ThiT [Acholeplasmataceae bacterium]